MFTKILNHLIVGAALLFGTSMLHAESPKTKPSIYVTTTRATALIETPEACGTGWLLDRQKKLVMTAQHVVGSNKAVKILFAKFRNKKPLTDRTIYRDADAITGRVIGNDVRRDLALIELESVPEEAEELKLATDAPDPSDEVHAVGFSGAGGTLWTYSNGRVRGIAANEWTDSEGEKHNARLVVSSININPGDSGSALVNNDAEVVGVNHGYLRDKTGVALAISADEIRAFLNDARKPKANRRGGEHVYLVETPADEKAPAAKSK